MPRKRTRRQPVARSAPQPREGFVAVGRVRGVHGVRGELKVDSLTDFPERFVPGAAVWAGGARYTVRGGRAHGVALLLKLEGIETREQAGALRGLLLEVPEEALAPLEANRYFHFQIVGIEVVDRTGRRLGEVAEVLATGANDVYIVRTAEGQLLLPAIDTVIREVDVAARRMVVELPEGRERRPLKRPP